MQFLVGILLAVIQGLTEFIPVSSTGHLAVAQYLLKFQEPPVVFDVVLHLGTLLAVVLYYRGDLLAMLKTLGSPSRLLHPEWNTDSPVKLLYLLILACIPTALIGFLLKSRIEGAFSNMHFVAFGFLLGGLIMILTLGRKEKLRDLTQMTSRDALLIGTMQGIAIFPGVTRSGTTISAALLLGLQPALAGRFSFILSIPAILGAVFIEKTAILSELQTGQDLRMYLICGAIAGIIGYLSIKPLIRILQSFRFFYFAFYCWFAGISLLVYLWLKA